MLRSNLSRSIRIETRYYRPDSSVVYPSLPKYDSSSSGDDEETIGKDPDEIKFQDCCVLKM